MFVFTIFTGPLFQKNIWKMCLKRIYMFYLIIIGAMAGAMAPGAIATGAMPVPGAMASGMMPVPGYDGINVWFITPT